MNVVNFNSENLKVDWISFNLEGFKDVHRLSKYFNACIQIDGKPKMSLHSFRQEYKVSIYQDTGLNCIQIFFCFGKTLIFLSFDVLKYFQKKTSISA